MVFYRKYRPQKLADLVGQEEISKNILAQLITGKIGHGYLFYGTRGTGKTSTARILAKAINCEKYRIKTSNAKSQTQLYGEPCNKCGSCLSITDGSCLDLIEIDAASNRGIDEMRDLREKVRLAPVYCPFKVYIIDEVHMLTNEAFNALLKTLEEPPAHVVFILATTEFNKLPATIVSRLQKFNFNRASRGGISQAISKIAKEEGIKINKEGIAAIADAADGSFRDAVSLLDQLSSNATEITNKDVIELSKISGFDALSGFLSLLVEGNLIGAIETIEEIAASGGDISLFIRQNILLLEKILLLKIGVQNVVDEAEGNLGIIRNLADSFSSGRLQVLIRLLLISEGEIRIYPLPHIPLVLAICKYVGEQEKVLSESFDKSQDKPKVSEASKVKEDLFLTSEKEKVAEEIEQVKVLKSADVENEKKKSVHSGASDEKQEVVVSGKSLLEVEKSWGEFLNRVRPVNAHVVALLRATKPSRYDGDNLTLEVFYRFHKDKLEEPKILKMLDTIMEETIGKKVRLHFILAKKESEKPPIVTRSNVIDVKGEELEKIAQEIFSK
jgi:DNA polymerase-3 subunit gamma/tau